MKKFLLLSSLLWAAAQLQAQNPIIPTPVSYTENQEYFSFAEPVHFNFEPQNTDLDSLAQWFSSSVLKSKLPNDLSKRHSIELKLNTPIDNTLGKEGYTLSVKAQQISIKANTPAGIFMGLQSLAQLLPVPLSNQAEIAKIKVKGCEITDYPQFAWRGLMLDVSRHFFTVAELKQYLELMAKYKFNVFHWHLTDDNGWRIQIKAFPKLTDIGAWRVMRYGKFGTMAPPMPNEPSPYGGFYTQEDVKDIIQFAAKRNITILPEIDIPGHSMALLAAYPQFSTKKEPKYVSPGNKFSEWYGNGKFKMLIENTLNPSDERVYGFLDTILSEVAQLFPGEYIHAGGDEAYHGYWENDPNCRAFMKKNNLKDGHDLQNYFMQRIAQIISAKGKKMIGWDEIIDENMDKNAAVMAWRGIDKSVQATKMQHPVVLSPTAFAYLDYTQGDKSIEFPIYDDLSLRKTYDFNPAAANIDLKYLLGGQGNLWTEQVPTLRHAFYMTYPRAFAISESLWSPAKNKNWNDFIRRVEIHFDRFDSSQVKIAKAIYDPIIQISRKNGALRCRLSSEIPQSSLYYTIDNTFPDEFSPLYKTDFELPAGDIILRVQNYRKGKAIGRMLSLSRSDLLKRAK